MSFNASPRRCISQLCGGVAPKTVLRWTAVRGLPGYRLGRALRYREADLEAWLQEHATADGAGRR
jgi:excisionase family DNA binding protein